MLLPHSIFAGTDGYIHKEANAFVRQSRKASDRCANPHIDTV
jgi:hypothetical protein